MLISDDDSNHPYFNPQFNDNNFIISLFRMIFAIDGGLVTRLCPTLVTSQTVAFQAPLSMGFSKQGYWSGLPFSSPGDFSDLGLLHCRKFLYQLSYQGSPQGYLLLFEDK